MKIAKQLMAWFLVLALMIGAMPTSVLAAEDPAVDNSVASVDNGNLTIEGSNGFGNLLSEEITEQQEAASEGASCGYTVTALEIEGNVATVTYDSLEEATLVVALYTEDGLQMLLSGTTTVLPEEITATVTLEGDMPQYFLASAYLLDSYDMSPLCPSYDTPLYTKEMQELLASTVDDYDADRVLNLDGDNTTNFAVYAEDTIVIEPVDGVNTVVSVDDDTLTYVIKNADSAITGLKVGDVFAYPYEDGEILIVKVDAITADGTTATITGEELGMEEVFTQVKIEAMGTNEILTVDESTGDEGITYRGMMETEPAVTPSLRSARSAANEGDMTGKLSLGFGIDKEIGSNKFEGSLKLDISVKFSYYISTTRQYVEFSADVNTAVAIEVSGKVSFPVCKLPSMGFSPVPGVYIGFEPKIVFEISAKVEASFNVNRTIGYAYENGKGVQDLSTSPKIDFSFEIEGSIFFGLDMAPKVGILDGWIAEVTLSAMGGIELKSEMAGTLFEDQVIIGVTDEPDSIHGCESCLNTELYFKTEFKIELQFLKFFETSFKLTEKRHPLGECYYSFDYREFGWGSCPHKSYRVTVQVQDKQGNDAYGIEVKAGWSEKLTEIPMGKTNSNGVIVDYLRAGTYTFMATVDEENLGKLVKVDEACKVVLNKDSIGAAPTFISGIVDVESVTDNGIIASGECGAEGDNVVWTLYRSGLLDIKGQGRMRDYGEWHFSLHPSWAEYSDSIKTIRIGEGITHIGSFSFWDCYMRYDYSSVKSVYIPSSINSIGYGSFCRYMSLMDVYIQDIEKWCNISFEGNPLFNGASLYVNEKLVSTLIIPENVTSIAEHAFQGCCSITSVLLPNNVTSIGAQAFTHCDNLRSVTIPNSVTSIGGSAFYGCKSLTSITIPNGVTSIGDNAFDLCYSLIRIVVEEDNAIYSSDTYGVLYNKNKTTLIKAPGAITSITIPSSVTSIGAGAFLRCYNLTNVSIPSSVTSIGAVAFGDCRNLPNIVIPNSVTSIGSGAFSDCESLTSITIPNSVTLIRESAFDGCTQLKDVFFTGDAPDIGTSIFVRVTATAYYPTDNGTWTSDVMQGYGGSITWVPYTPGEVQMACAGGESIMMGGVSSNVSQSNAVYGGAYSTKVKDAYTLKTAAFEHLIPGAEYVLLSLASIEVENPLAAENLLYIDQAVAGEDGTLSFQYVQRVDTAVSYVMACGPSNKNLADATITFPEMQANGETALVEPVVTYDGKVLTENVDYVIVGDVDYEEAGEYTCYIRGIYQYTGLVRCDYRVASAGVSVSGVIESFGEADTVTVTLLHNDEEICNTTADAEGRYSIGNVPPGTYTLRISKENHITRTYTVTMAEANVTVDATICLIGDVNADGKLNMKDWIRLYDHISEVSPLNGYTLQCADVNADGKINMKDWVRVYDHLSETKPLW